MILSIILFSLMISVFISYVGYIWIKYGIQKSISESFYILQENNDKSWYFIAFTWLFAFPAMILGDSYLMTLAAGGIVFVGAAAAMHEKFVRKFHMIGAVGGIIASQLAIWIQYDMWWLTLISFSLVIPILAFKKLRKNAMWWMELVAFIAISITLGISIF